MLLVPGCVDGIGDERMVAFGANHKARLLTDRLAAARMAHDASQPVAVHRHFVDGEGLSHFSPGCYRRIDQDLVEQVAPRAVSHAFRGRRWHHGSTHVGGEGAYRWWVRREHGIEQAPAFEGGNA